MGIWHKKILWHYKKILEFCELRRSSKLIWAYKRRICNEKVENLEQIHLGFREARREKQFSGGDVADAPLEPSQELLPSNGAADPEQRGGAVTLPSTIRPRSALPCNYKNEHPECWLLVSACSLDPLHFCLLHTAESQGRQQQVKSPRSQHAGLCSLLLHTKGSSWAWDKFQQGNV